MSLDNINESLENIIKKILEENYNIEVLEIEKSDESTDGNVYIIYGMQNKYVVKVYDNLDHTNQMINLHILLEKNNINAPKIISDNDNKHYEEVKNKYIVVYSFIEGKKIRSLYVNGKLEEKIIKKLAISINKLHSIKAGNNFLKLPELSFEEKGKVNKKSILHFDLTKENIIVDKDQVYFIDFDDSKYGDCICDAAIMISFLFLSKTNGADLEGIKCFIKEYFKEGNIQDEEKLKIKEYALAWADYLLSKDNIKLSTKESFEEKRKLIEKFL